jgi:hypothetical protein
MPIGAGSLYGAAVTGGSKDAVVVSHTHSVTDPGHAHFSTWTDYTGGGGSGFRDPVNPGTGTYHVDTNTNTTGISIASSGESGTNKNLPPYLGIYFIIKT